MSIGIFGLIILLVVGGVAAAVILTVRTLRAWRKKAQLAGYSSLGEYLRGAPRSDQERKDSVDMALKGFIICVAGLLFPPLILIGIFPLFFGVRKIAYWSVGLGLYEDSSQAGA